MDPRDSSEGQRPDPGLITLREATVLDVDAVVALQPVCFPEDPWTRGMIEEEIRRPGGLFLIAEGVRPVVGFAIGWNVLGELHVLQVAVRPDQRRTGLGRALMDRLEAQARGAEAAWLEVRADNAAAIGLYVGLDYQPVGRRTRYYPDGCDAVVMRKRLGA